MEITVITNSPEETVSFAEKLGKNLRGGEILAYFGGLGAGKTTFTRGLAAGLSLKCDVSSPTFSLVNEYRGDISLIHFDMYRVLGEESLETTGFYDYMDEKSVLAVEWSENIADCLPDGTVFIEIERISDDTRKITVKGEDRFAYLGN